MKVRFREINLKKMPQNYTYCSHIFSNQSVYLCCLPVYCIPAGWLWADHGYMKEWGVVDIAGSGGVHLGKVRTILLGTGFPQRRFCKGQQDELL